MAQLRDQAYDNPTEYLWQGKQESQGPKEREQGILDRQTDQVI